MRNPISAGLCCLAFISALIVPGAGLAQTDDEVRLLLTTVLPDSRDTKLPHITTDGGSVTAVSNVEAEDAHVWTKPATAQTFGAPFRIGPAEGQPPYSTMAAATGPDSRTSVAWISQRERAIYFRTRELDGNWGPTRTVNRGSPFPTYVEVAVASDGAIFVAWQDPDRPIRFRRSTDGGATWSVTTNLTNTGIQNVPFGISAGPDGRVGLAWTQGLNDKLQVYVGLWNGSAFAVQRVSDGANDFSNPTITFRSDGTPVAAWRGVARSGGASGVFFAERQSDGSWPRSRLVGGDTIDNVSISADEQGGLHMAWISRAAGPQALYYATRPAGGVWRGPFAATVPRESFFNPRMAVGSADARYVHAVAERWVGDGKPNVRYFLLRSGVVFATATPKIEGDIPRVRGLPSVNVRFEGIAGNPTQVRWRWEAPPDDTANDSGGWQGFTETIAVPVPQAFLTDTRCQARTLYTQVRSDNSLQQTPQSDSVSFDTSVEAEVRMVNPLTLGAPALPAGASAGNPPGTHDVMNAGAPGYTRVPFAWLQVIGNTDCGGLDDVAFGRSAESLGPPYPVDDAVVDDDMLSMIAEVPYLGTTGETSYPIRVQVTDEVDNTRLYDQNLVFDRSPPALDANAPGQLRLEASQDATILQTLVFTNVRVSDNLYPERGFWGVAIANSRTPVDNPADDPRLQWTAVGAPGEAASFTITGWSLASGLAPEAVTPGEYYVYVRFLDGAGNLTNGWLVSRTSLNEITRPRTHLPVVGR